ncbi:MAG: 16S rRNA (uracil(1498)-N(3))-methyltransferase [Pseudomonadota bacterium]
MAIHDFRSQRLFVDTELSAGKEVNATREQANYLLNVLRLTNGSQLLIFNGLDGEWRAEIKVEGKKNCSLCILDLTREQPAESNLVYCFAPLKQARQDYMVQKAVEMGVGKLQPILTQYTQVRRVNEKRMRANVIEAAEQCGILNLPEIRSPIPLHQLPETLSAGSVLFFCDETLSGHRGIDELDGKDGQEMAVMIGPEGGFSDEERNLVNSWSNVITLGLGPRILRADTAAVAALAIVQAKVGDWYTT